MPSAIKKLKTDLHANRTQKPKSKGPQKAQKQAKSHNAASNRFRNQETPAQRAHRLRTEKLLPELQRRHKAGGIIDRRIGENDPTLAPEDRMLQRYAAEGQRKRKSDVFNLEDEDSGGAEEMLTHFGRPLSEGNHKERSRRDDAESDTDHEEVDGEDGADLFHRSKRKLEDAIDEVTRQQANETEDGEPARKKSRTEVMKEVIAKSKFHKHERQAAKENYDDQREELDKQLPDLLSLLGGGSKGSGSKLNLPDAPHANGNAPVNGAAKENPDKTYDQRVRQMTQEQRAKPSNRTKTEEEKAEEYAAHLQKLEENRQRRMRGEQEVRSDVSNNSDEDDAATAVAAGSGGDSEDEAGEAGAFGLDAMAKSKLNDEIEDEDNFEIEDDLIASGSDVDIDPSDEEIEQAPEDAIARQEKELPDGAMDEDDAEFLKDVLPTTQLPAKTSQQPSQKEGSLAYTYPCPQTHEELLEVLARVDYKDIPTVIQRIRALYHPSIAEGNKDKLAAFACALVDHLHYLTTLKSVPPLEILEQVIRHVHSLSRAQPLPIGHRFRHHLQRMHQAASNQGPDDDSWLKPGDLTLLTAIGTIYPTSDHFHQVVKPAITLMARWLGTTASPTLKDVATSRMGAYIVALIIRYQQLSKRYVPEVIRFIYRLFRTTLKSTKTTTKALSEAICKSLIQHLQNITALATLYKDKSAFAEIFRPFPSLLQNLTTLSPSLENPAKSAAKTLNALLKSAQNSRKPLELHHHRPRPIRMSIPQFDDHFNPTKHNDPDPDRSESNKLRKEHKKEKKGAMRELRRDAEFVARRKLVEKKEKDRVYEEKFRRIVGGIEREEGQGRREYEREREERRRAKRR
ncbi:MAG: hypothetical protein Q9162_007113 [Coniocarpon cinnabarinum]